MPWPAIAIGKRYARPWYLGGPTAALPAAHPGTAGDAAYLRLLHLAASTQEAEVQAALEWVLEAGQVPEPDRVGEWVRPAPPVVPALAIPAVELASDDALLRGLTR